MLAKEQVLRKPRQAQNIANISSAKRRVTTVQKENLQSEKSAIASDGIISDSARLKYKKAIEFINEHNELMSQFLTKKRDNGGDFPAGFHITRVPNFMEFFEILVRRTEKVERSNAATQTLAHHGVKEVLKCKNTNPKNGEGNIVKLTEQIQESQYKHYSKSRSSKNESLGASGASRPSGGSIRKTSSNILGKQFQDESSNSKNSPSVRKYQSFGTFPSVINQKHSFTGLLSNNGMIASEINAKGTPLIVKSMFEEIQSPPGVFVSRGSILKNLSANSSGSSVILTDTEDGPRNSAKFTSPPPPPQLVQNGKSLNDPEKKIISSLGIFDEDGALKENAKSYLENKEGVKRGLFRIPRVSQVHLSRNFRTNSCTSNSLVSDNLSAQSSDIKSDC